MSGLNERQRLMFANALVQDRFGKGQLDSHLIEPHIDCLLNFEAGRVSPTHPSLSVDGISLVDPHFDTLVEGIRADKSTRPWPTGAPMAIAVTHDVDLFDGLSYFGLRAAGWVASSAHALLRVQLTRVAEIMGRGLQWTKWWLANHDPVADLAHWQALEAEHGIRSTFFFLALAQALSKEGRLYRVDDPKVKQTLRSLRDGGWEIGLHAARYESDDALGLSVNGHGLKMPQAARCRPFDTIT